jgi:hypothetical protein
MIAIARENKFIPGDSSYLKNTGFDRQSQKNIL